MYTIISLILQTLLFFLVITSISSWLLAKKPKHCPPSPSSLPIIGHLHHLGPRPNHSILKLSKKLGSIIYLRFGSVSNFFITSPELTEQVLKTNDTIFANRPISQANQFLTYNYKGFSFTDYGPHWRTLRKFMVMKVMSSQHLKAVAFIQAEEMDILVETIKKKAVDGDVALNLTECIYSVVSDIMCRVLLGKKCMDDNLGGGKLSEHIIEMLSLMITFDISDYFWFLRPFDVQGHRRRMKAVMAPVDRFLEKVIDEHVEAKKSCGGHGKDEESKDYIDHMLDALECHDFAEFQFDRTIMKATILDIFEGSLDASSVTVEWALVELLRNKNVMTKLQDELKNVVGMHQMVNDSHISLLPYLDNVIMETLRLHPIVQFLPRRAKQEVNIGGYTIPRESNVFLCNWAMSRDPNVWSNAEEFIPERFEGRKEGNNIHYLPFGFGRRSCPGPSLGLMLVSLILAIMVHCFDWQLPIGVSPQNLDMKEKLGLTLARACNLFAHPKYRLKEK